MNGVSLADAAPIHAAKISTETVLSRQKPRKIILLPPRFVFSIIAVKNRLSSKRQEAQMHVMSGEKTHLSKMKLI
jgi:hypothetical protein